MKLFVFGAIAGAAFIGAVIYFLSRRGWLRNGYFTIPAIVFIVIGLFIAFQAIGGGAVVAAVGLSMEDHPMIALTLNGLSEILVMLIGSLVISLAVRQHPFKVFRLEGISETPFSAYILALPIILAAQFAGGALSAIWMRVLKFSPDFYAVIGKYETASDKAQENLVTAHGLGEFAIIFLFVAIVPGFAEETLFRGFSQSNIERSGHHRTRPYIALIVTSILFASVHGSVFKFPGLLMLGLALGWMAYRTSNLLVGALAHAANNGFIVIALYFVADQISAKANQTIVSPDELPAMQALLIFIPAVLILALLIYYFHRVTSNLHSRDNAEHELQAHLASNSNHSDESWRNNDKYHDLNDTNE